jgi:hypothetical protein
VMEVLQRLPELTYRSVRDLWRDLADLPVAGPQAAVAGAGSVPPTGA